MEHLIHHPESKVYQAETEEAGMWEQQSYNLLSVRTLKDRLCGLVVRVSGYKSRCPGFYSRRFQIFWAAAGLERGPLSLVKTTEELLEGKVAALV
jgi:hypothetical protein